MTDIINRLMSMGSMGPELVMQLMGMIIDAVGQGEEWTGESLERLGQITQQLADKIEGVKGAKGGGG